MMHQEWETVIGLEVHAQLKTRSKLFSSSPTAFGAPPNTQICELDVGAPGTLPVLNRAAVDMAIKLGLGLNANIQARSVFSRKHYFYPDLPKGYQITQHHYPIIRAGQLAYRLPSGEEKCTKIAFAHLEEDAGKSVHDVFDTASGIDLNRAGVPLVEIVSEPDMRSPEQAVCYLKALRTLLLYLDVCDGNMQEGSLRCDVNVSVRLAGETTLGTRVEVKNVNSFRAVSDAIIYESQRQIKRRLAGQVIDQETRLYDPDKGETRALRNKENAQDYRYFDDPDLLPLQVTVAQIQAVRDSMPELPWVKKARFVADYALSEKVASFLVSDPYLADFYEEVVSLSSPASPIQAANWVTVELGGALNKEALCIKESKLNATQLATLLRRIEDKTISGKIAKQVFVAAWAGEHAGDIDAIIAEKGLRQITDAGQILQVVEAVLVDHPQQLSQYRAGKEKLFGFFVGQVMKRSQGKANPDQVNQMLRRKLHETD